MNPVKDASSNGRDDRNVRKVASKSRIHLPYFPVISRAV
jgi:hypothetical protein